MSVADRLSTARAYVAQHSGGVGGIVRTPAGDSAGAKLAKHLRAVGTKLGLDDEQLHDVLELTPGDFVRFERGGHLPSFAERRRMATALGVEHAQFEHDWRHEQVRLVAGAALRREGKPDLNLIAVINLTPAGRPIDYEEYSVASGVGQHYILPPEHLEDEVEKLGLFAFIVMGDSMKPAYADGDLIVARPVDKGMDPESDEAKALLPIGAPAYVRFSADVHSPDVLSLPNCCTFKTWHPGKGPRVKLRPMNKRYRGMAIERDEIEQLSAVAWHMPGWAEAVANGQCPFEPMLIVDEPVIDPVAAAGVDLPARPPRKGPPALSDDPGELRYEMDAEDLPTSGDLMDDRRRFF